MSRKALSLVFLGVVAATAACSGTDPQEREPLLPVEYRDGGFSVGRVSYTGVCEATAFEQCRSDTDACYDRCGGFSGDLVLSCLDVCGSYDCASKGDLCVDFIADFDFGPADATLAGACAAWEEALQASCEGSWPEGFCQRVATTWKPEFASILDCSAESARAGVCFASCELPGSSFGDDLCVAMGNGPEGCRLNADANLLGGVLRDDVIEAAFACLSSDYDPTINSCLAAWGDGVVPWEREP